MKECIGIRDIKSYERVKQYFEDVHTLKQALHRYHSKTQKKEASIYALILK